MHYNNIMKYILIALTLLFAGNAVAASRSYKIRPPAFSAKSYLIADSEGRIIKEQDSDTIRPIASISKLMVALLASEQDLGESLEIPEVRQVHSSIPRKVSSLTRKELLTLALVKSDNLAAQVLCTNISDCVYTMNNKAIELGMTDTHYEEPTGLSRKNVSTAHDLLKLLLIASANSTITELSSMSTAEIPTDKKPIKIRNTNPLVSKFNIVLSKTGYTNPAGGCLVIVLNTLFGERILILLGSRNAKTRIPDMEKLIKES
jgi:D-alanyl-D-alanine endopeptidase (penicillin-binding protein 7)